ncbi:hypothetical protein [Streptomyces sp. NPDC014006]|uniref:hypothetical protein n=1 Tax=Streptomyces sp. NPDC014006 TaxID=3364870 RepID=UPI0036FAEB61
MRIKLASMLGVAVMTSAVIVAGPATATAQPTAAPQAASCFKGWTTQAKESVKIRNARKLNATALGLFPKGKKGKYASCAVEDGQKYSLCGWKNDYRWTKINYRGTVGWIPTACETWVP